MLKVHNQIVFAEFAEINLGAMTFGASKPQKPSGVNCESSEQFGSRQHHEVGPRETKSSGPVSIQPSLPWMCGKAGSRKPGVAGVAPSITGLTSMMGSTVRM